jgi:thiamine biosynthesis lipoprotein
MRLDLGGIGKGFALDAARAELERHGIRAALVVGGGEMVAAGPPPGTPGWSVELVGLGGEVERITLAQGAVATSGDLEQALELGDQRHSHILDPRTGRALTERRLVTVLGPRATWTDGLATALCVLGPAAGAELLARYPDYGARFQSLSAVGVRELRSGPFPRPVSCPPSAPRPPAPVSP